MFMSAFLHKNVQNAFLAKDNRTSVFGGPQPAGDCGDRQVGPASSVKFRSGRDHHADPMLNSSVVLRTTDRAPRPRTESTMCFVPPGPSPPAPSQSAMS